MKYNKKSRKRKYSHKMKDTFWKAPNGDLYHKKWISQDSYEIRRTKVYLDMGAVSPSSTTHKSSGQSSLFGE